MGERDGHHSSGVRVDEDRAAGHALVRDLTDEREQERPREDGAAAVASGTVRAEHVDREHNEERGVDA